MFKFLRLRLNAAKRLGAFKQAMKSGMSQEQARKASDQLYPPTAEDLEFEAALRNGSAKPLPLASAVALLYPVAATIYALTTPAGKVAALGYGVTNLGYLLFVAGVVRGSFLAFGFRTRPRVFVAGVVCFIIGVVLSNVGA